MEVVDAASLSGMRRSVLSADLRRCDIGISVLLRAIIAEWPRRRR